MALTPQKITARTALTGANLASGDLFPAADVSAAGAAKNVILTRDEMRAGLLRGVVPQAPIWSDANSYLGPGGGTLNTGAITIDRLYMLPIFVPSKRTFTTLAVSTTATGASSHLRIGLYNADPVTFQPTTLIFAGDNILDTGTGTGLKTTPFNAGAGIELFPGLHYLACVGDGTSATYNRLTSLTTWGGGWHALTTAIGPNMGYYRAYSYAALQADETGNTFSSLASAGTACPIMLMR